MASPPLRVALTGGIATGKSYCLTRFAELGAATIDADRLARDAVAPATPGFAAVVERFGSDILDATGALDRAALGRVVFADERARRDLEQIIHPRVYAAVESWYAALQGGAPAPPVAIADIPLLYETGREQEFDRVVVVACRPEQQAERLMARSGLSREDALARIVSQRPITDKTRRGDYVIDTSRSFDESDRQIREVWAQLTRDASGPR